MIMSLPFKMRTGANYGLKTMILVLLVILFLIPQGLIVSLVNERDRLAEEAVDSMYQPLGGTPAWAGPFLTVPATFTDRDSKGEIVLRDSALYFTAASSSARISTSLDELVRGIYKAPVLTAATDLSFSFKPDAKQLAQLNPVSVDWSRASLFIAIPDARLLSGEAYYVDSDGKQHKLKGDLAPIRGYDRALSLDIDLSAAQELDGSLKFSLRGGNNLMMAAGGGDVSVSIESPWLSPSFYGFVLPVERTLNDSGFSARWFLPESVSHLPAIFESTGYFDRLDNASFGVAFIEPVDANRKAYRAANYAFLFIAIPFCVLFLFEVFTGLRLHPIQYCLIGFANMVFYLLLLSISEHAGFVAAYLLAAAATSVVVGLYFKAISGGHKAWWAGMVSMVSLYGLLYAMLLSEDYALLIGSVCLFAASAAVMWFTRKINWYGNKSGTSAASGQVFESLSAPVSGSSMDSDRE